MNLRVRFLGLKIALCRIFENDNISRNKTWSSVSNSSFLFKFIQKFQLFLVAGKKSTLCLFARNFVSEKNFCMKNVGPEKQFWSENILGLK